MGFVIGRELYEESRENKNCDEHMTKKIFIIDDVGYKYTSTSNRYSKMWRMELASEAELDIPTEISEFGNGNSYTVKNMKQREKEFNLEQPINHIIKAVSIIKSGDKGRIMNLVKSFDNCSYGEFHTDGSNSEKKHYSFDIFKFLSDNIQDDKIFIKQLLKIKPQIYCFLNENVQCDEEILAEMALRRAFYPEVIDNILKLDDINKFILENVDNPFRYFPELKKDRNFVEQYIAKNKISSTNMVDSKPQLWICAVNDLESFAIVEMLEECAVNDRNINVVVSKQLKNPRWEHLEEDIKSRIEQAQIDGYDIYGVRLQGTCEGATNIEYRKCGEDDSFNQKTSIEQVAEKLGIKLTIDEQFISANCRGYIPEMKRLGKLYGIDEKDLQGIIKYVRSRDRKLQGISTEEEIQAIKYDDCLKETRGTYIKVELENSKFIAVVDRLYGKYDNIIVECSNGKTIFYGEAKILDSMKKDLKDSLSNKWQVDDEHVFIDISSKEKLVERYIEDMVKRDDTKQSHEQNILE